MKRIIIFSFVVGLSTLQANAQYGNRLKRIIRSPYTLAAVAIYALWQTGDKYLIDQKQQATDLQLEAYREELQMTNKLYLKDLQIKEAHIARLEKELWIKENSMTEVMPESLIKRALAETIQDLTQIGTISYRLCDILNVFPDPKK